MRTACLAGALALALVVIPSPVLGAGSDAAKTPPLSVATPLDETGQDLPAATLEAVRAAVVRGLRADGLTAQPLARPPAAMEVRPSLIQCAPPAMPPTAQTRAICIGSVAVAAPASDRIAFTTVARTPLDGGLSGLAAAMADAVARGLRPPPMPPSTQGEDISATGTLVRHLGDGRITVADTVIDLHAIAHAYNPAVDKDVPDATNITLNDTVPQRDSALITLYQIDPPLTGVPSREQGIDCGTDFRDPANLVKGAYTNYVSPVLTADPVPVRVASHPIGHFMVRVEIPGYPTLLTGMTTIARADKELVDLTLGRRLGVGGVLLTPQPGRLNSAAEVARELALRQRQLRVVDGLWYHWQGGRNVGPKFDFDDGRVMFLRVRLKLRNATDALAYFAEYVRRGEHDQFGSLLNSPFKGNGAGCAGFAMGWLQAAGAIPFITDPPPGAAVAARDPDAFWHAARASLHIPWRDIGCDERVGAARINPAQLTVYDMLLHNETPALVRRVSEGLAAHIAESYGGIAATLFQIGAYSPLGDIVLNLKRLDPADRGDYGWGGPGLDLRYWDNVRFAAWVRRVWQEGPVDPRVTLVREGRFQGVEIDATAAPRQSEPFFADADRIYRARLAGGPPALTCQEVFARGLQ